MASLKQIAANRHNATRSTGPRTACGKSRARANALRHGLLSKALADTEHGAKTEELARRIAREHGKPEDAIEAKIVAEADMEILKIRALRAKLLDAIPIDDNADSRDEVLPNAARATDQLVRRSTEQSNLTLSYLDEIQQLLALDRYEQRAISRRRHALRHLREPTALR